MVHFHRAVRLGAIQIGAVGVVRLAAVRVSIADSPLIV
jgi:hypothetical protein